MELVLIIIASALLIPLSLFTERPVRIALGLLFVLFFPGYTLMAALFPRKTSPEAITRLAFSAGTSIALVIVLLLLLNATPWGIELSPTLSLIFLFTAVMASIAWWRRRRFNPEERFDPAANLKPALVHLWTKKGHLDRALTALLVLAIIGVIGTLGFAIARPMAEEDLTEFYLLDLQEKMDYYPGEMAVGEEGEVIIGIVNREHRAEVYNVEIVLDGVKTNEIGPINLVHEEKWEQAVSFTPARIGSDQKVEIRLYKESRQLYRILQLWIDVNGEVI